MLRELFVMCSAFALVVPNAAAADTQAARANLSVAQIVDKNVTARGGLQAWQSVKALVFQGKMGVGGNQRAALPVAMPGKKLTSIPTDPRPKDEIQLPFTMTLQRPHKERLELQFKGQTALQIYDGSNGWKLRPYLNRRVVESYTPDELKIASSQAELDGYLVDYAAKGTRIELDGIEKVEDRDAYKLKLTFSDGRTLHLWIDAQTFLETKVEGQPRRLDGVEHPVEIYYRDYHSLNGLEVPFLLETRVLPVASKASKVKSDAPVQVEKISIEKVEVNPSLNASLFAKPQSDGLPSRN